MALPGFVASSGNYTALPLSEHAAGGGGGASVVETFGAIAELTDANLATKFAASDDAQPGDLIEVDGVLHRMKEGSTDARLAASWGPATAVVDTSGLATTTALNAAIARISTLEAEPPPDLTPYARSSDIPDVSSFITATALDPYAQKTELPDLTPYAQASDIPDVSNFITSTALPDLTPYAQKTELPASLQSAWSDSANADYGTPGTNSYQGLDAWIGPKLSGIPTSGTISDLSGRVTTLEEEGFITSSDLPSLAPYALKTELPDLTPYARSSDVPDVSSFITATALSPYALKTELPDVSGFASTSALANYATTSSLSNYATTSSLSSYATATALADLTNRVATLEGSVSGLGTKQEVTFLTNQDQYQPNSTELSTTPTLVNAGFDLTAANIMRVALRGDIGQAGSHEIGNAWFDNTMINLWGSNWSAKAPVVVNGVTATLTLSATSNVALKNGDFSISLDNLGGGKVFFMKIIAYQWVTGNLLV